MRIRRVRTPLENYRRMSEMAAGTVIGKYSTSFSLASRTLSPQVRTDVANLYAMVRIADEIVDGVAAEVGLEVSEVAIQLANFEEETFRAIATGFSANPILQAFADTTNRVGLDHEHIRAFFASMSNDLAQTSYDPVSLDEYVYGSAEVIGLMCLSIFLHDHPLPDRAYATCVIGAKKLGRAFQKINFLRDHSTDSKMLGRTYISLTEADKSELISEIRKDLSLAFKAIPLLPMVARTGVLAAYLLFSELTDLLDEATVEDILGNRVSVSKSRKTLLALRAVSLAPRMKEV